MRLSSLDAAGKLGWIFELSAEKFSGDKYDFKVSAPQKPWRERNTLSHRVASLGGQGISNAPRLGKSCCSKSDAHRIWLGRKSPMRRFQVITLFIAADKAPAGHIHFKTNSGFSIM
jgi:hypothetical protein